MSKVGTISNKNQINSINKYYNIAKILLAISPCMSLMYLSMESAKLGISLAEVIGQDPNQTVMFLVSMINPFIAYLLTFIQKKIENNDVKYAIVNLAMFMVAEILLMNLLYVISFGVTLYKTLRAYNVTIKDSFKEKLGKGFFMTVSGSLVVIFLAGICLFATIRINM